MLGVLRHEVGPKPPELSNAEFQGGTPPREFPLTDLVFADPPYNQGVKYDGDETLDRMNREEYIGLLYQAATTAYHLARPGATLWWVCPSRDVEDVSAVLKTAFGPRQYLIVWHETFAQYNRYDLTEDYRFVLCHRKPGGEVTKNLDDIRVPSRRMELGDKRAAGPRIPGQVWQLRRLQGTAAARVDWHPAQLPPELLTRIVNGWTNERDWVTELFAGSGSMGVACHYLQRNYVGVERSQEYCDKMIERFGAFS